MSDALDKMRARVNEQTRKYLALIAEDWRGNVTRRFGRGAITSRSGKLAGSLSYTITGADIRDFQLRMVTAGVPYARVQEFGGTIRAKKKYLTIPLDAMRTAAGVTRQPFRQWLDAAKASGIVRWIKRPNGWLVAWAPSKQAQGALYWKLQPQVTIRGPKTTGEPSRFGFFDTWHAGRTKREGIFRRMFNARAIFGGGA